MYLENIKLIQFKNYEEQNFTPSAGANCLIGLNGSGKTNLLDSIYYTAFFKSFFHLTDAQLTLDGYDFFRIESLYNINNKNFKVEVAHHNKDKKLMRLNGDDILKVSDHVGKIPLVLITPYDTDLVREGAELRRKFVDGVLCQFDKKYLENLLKYNHFLKQRNALLKIYGKTRQLDSTLINNYDLELCKIGREIFNVRLSFVVIFEPIFQKYFGELSDNLEHVSLKYKSDMYDADYEINFFRALDRDKALERTTMGIHTDDFEFEIFGKLLRKFGSQGQQKSYVIALKLAQLEFMHQKMNQSPILLLDDIFDKIDDKRIKALTQLVSKPPFGQLIITDASPERSPSLLRKVLPEIALFKVESGRIEEM